MMTVKIERLSTRKRSLEDRVTLLERWVEENFKEEIEMIWDICNKLRVKVEKLEKKANEKAPNKTQKKKK